MKLSANEVNTLIDKCSYGGDYEGLGKRLVSDKPKKLRLSINEKDLLSSWLERATTEAELSIKEKLCDKKENYK